MSNQPNRPLGPNFPPIEIPPEMDVTYVNVVRIAHSPSELVFDFAHLVPGGVPAKIRSRIVMSPLGAKLFYRALAENLSKYEAAFGEINVPGDNTLADSLFRAGGPSTPPPSPNPDDPAAPPHSPPLK
jgi:hypothetical protein